MKKYIILSFFIAFLSCEDIIDQAIDNAIEANENENTLFVSIKNNTQFTFDDPKITVDDYTYVFQDVPPDSYSGGTVFAYTYSEAKVTTKINGELFVFIPLTLHESTLVTKGNYIFELDILDYDQQKLSIKRVKF